MATKILHKSEFFFFKLILLVYKEEEACQKNKTEANT